MTYASSIVIFRLTVTPMLAPLLPHLRLLPPRTHFGLIMTCYLSASVNGLAWLHQLHRIILSNWL